MNHETRFRVRYAETDQMGVVYYANYYVWMEIGRAELIRSSGFSYLELERTGGYLLSVVESQCRYLAPARYDQEVLVVTRIASSNARLVEFHYEIRDSGTNQMLARGMTKHLWLDRSFKPTRLPEEYLQMLNSAIMEK